MSATLTTTNHKAPTSAAMGMPIAGIGTKSANTTHYVLEATDLTKVFNGTAAVDGLSFHLAPGEVFGFLGPNGAGKSTTVGMILGLVKPTRGKVKIAGQELTSNPAIVSENIGAIIENPAFYPYLTGRDNLRAFGMMSGGVSDARVNDLLKLVNMADRADRPYKTFSLGMKQRIGIAATLLTNPAIVILDEPTNGLDPAGQREIREIIPRLAEEGHSVMLASHLLHEVEQVSSRIAIVRRGKLIREGRVDELLSQGGYVEVIVPALDVTSAMRALGHLPFVQRIDAEGGTLNVTAPDDSGAAINRTLVENGIFASGIVAKRESLEDLFLELTEDEPGAHPAD